LCSRGVRGNLGFGYEVVNYFNGLSSIRRVDDVEAFNTFNDYRNVSMHGPYASVAFNF
jgi:hypothetical protein